MPFNPLDHPLILLSPERLSAGSTWLGHMPFAYALVSMAQPRVLVELGVSSGDSYCVFCQAMKAVGSGKAFGVDTWRGDAHEGELEAYVLNQLREYHDPRYGDFSTLVESDFDSALSRFADGEIDVLHIDGLHTYEAVSHDFHSWRPKLSDRAVVLFHDTQIRDRGFGVWKLWEELATSRPSFEFHHSCGLGVLAYGSNPPPALLEFLEVANVDPDSIRRLFYVLGERIEQIRMTQIIMGRAHQQYLLINEWKRLVGAVPSSEFMTLNDALARPYPFLDSLHKALREVCQDDLNLRQRLAKG